MRKENRKYYFSVEGETEKWYFEWLQRAINANADAAYTVRFDCRIQKDPLKLAKGLVVRDKIEITHVADRESEEEIHVKQFQTALERMKQAERLKSIKYSLGYSNFAFELWIILHKADCNGRLNHRRQYLPLLNQAFGEQFENLDQYKHEDNFKRVLGKLALDDVGQAIRRAKQIMRLNQENGYVLHQHKGYRYYKENPSLSIWEVVKRVMNECEVL